VALERVVVVFPIDATEPELPLHTVLNGFAG